jgi:hypothetical protein
MRQAFWTNSFIAAVIPVCLAVLRWRAPETSAKIFRDIHQSSLIEAILGGSLALAALLASVVSVMLLYVQSPHFEILRKTGKDRVLLDSFNQTIYWALAGIPLFAAAAILDISKLTYVALLFFSSILFQVLQCIVRLRGATLIVTKRDPSDFMETDPEQQNLPLPPKK